MIFTVERDGTAEQVDIDLALDYFTPPEADRAAAALAEIDSPDELTLLRVLTWAKVATHFPELPLDGFELDPPSEVDPTQIPMKVLDG